jgi:hypothetical protein
VGGRGRYEARGQGSASGGRARPRGGARAARRATGRAPPPPSKAHRRVQRAGDAPLGGNTSPPATPVTEQASRAPDTVSKVVALVWFLAVTVHASSSWGCGSGLGVGGAGRGAGWGSATALSRRGQSRGTGPLPRSLPEATPAAPHLALAEAHAQRRGAAREVAAARARDRAADARAGGIGTVGGVAQLLELVGRGGGGVTGQDGLGGEVLGGAECGRAREVGELAAGAR